MDADTANKIDGPTSLSLNERPEQEVLRQIKAQSQIIVLLMFLGEKQLLCW